MTDKNCKVLNCDRKYSAKGYCDFHYRRHRKGVKVDAPPWAPTVSCAVDSCTSKHVAKGYCGMHYERWKKHGDPTIRYVSRAKPFKTNGYIRRPWTKDHPNTRQKDGYIFEHVLVMSQKLGRPLLPHENVHHINGVRDDNRPENLELWSKSQPPGQRVEDKIQWAKELLENYLNEEELSSWLNELLIGEDLV